MFQRWIEVRRLHSLSKLWYTLDSHDWLVELSPIFICNARLTTVMFGNRPSFLRTDYKVQKMSLGHTAPLAKSPDLTSWLWDELFTATSPSSPDTPSLGSVINVYIISTYQRKFWSPHSEVKLSFRNLSYKRNLWTIQLFLKWTIQVRWVGGKQQRLLILLAEHFYLLVWEHTKGKFFLKP